MNAMTMSRSVCTRYASYVGGVAHGSHQRSIDTVHHGLLVGHMHICVVGEHV